jgi:hypothetical protein
MHALNKIATALTLALAGATLAPPSLAADVKMIGKVDAITLAADGKSAVVSVVNAKGGEPVSVKVKDKTTLDKIADKSIGKGDQVRLSYDNSGGANLSKTLKKAEGC